MTDKFKNLLDSKAGQIVALVVSIGLVVGIAANVVNLDGLFGRGMDAEQFRKIVSEEVQRGGAPLRAGIMKLAEAQSIQTQNAVLRAMMAAERRAETQQ